MFQKWRWLTFLHWRYRPDDISPLLPPGLAPDTYDGSAWIGLTPFLLKGLRAPFMPPMPWISRFPEMNVRTYVRGPDGEPGIWFFTLEAARLAAVLGARVAYGLPYRWADMGVRLHGDTVQYTSGRKWPFGSAFANIEVQIGEPDSARNARHIPDSALPALHHVCPAACVRGHRARALAATNSAADSARAERHGALGRSRASR